MGYGEVHESLYAYRIKFNYSWLRRYVAWLPSSKKYSGQAPEIWKMFGPTDRANF
jgi:hypothetical protein